MQLLILLTVGLKVGWYYAISLYEFMLLSPDEQGSEVDGLS